MEIFAFTHAAAAYEDPSPAPQMRSLTVKVPSSAWIGMAALAVGLSIVGTAPSAMAARLGDVGPEVTAIQQALTDLGFAPGPVDGVYGPSTELAVRNFQVSVPRLVVDGIAGPATETVLGLRDGVDPGSIGTDPGPLVQQGDSGATVTAIQDTLKALGFFPASIASTGFYGTVTVQAIREFQAENGLVVDGVAGPSTQGLLLDGSTNPSPVDPQTVRVSTSGSPLNVRSGPGPQFGVIDALGNGTVVGVTGDVSGGWVELSGGGWVSSGFVI
ncbi:MAG: peptidoglycan-binding protein [Elainellaceae cyanobacterium]